MQSPREQTLENILDRAERRESQARRRAILYTLVPIVMASILLAYSSSRIRRETEQVKALQGDAAQFERQISDLKREAIQYEERIEFLKSELELSEQRLKKAVELSQYTHPVDFVDLKVIFSRYPRQARALDLILSLRQRNVGWHLGGQTPEQGFDSPSFAMFVLHELGVPTGRPQPEESLLEASRELFERLERGPGPDVGDLAFYPAGYVLFYFKDEHNSPFVIGMTPAGITALKPDFSSPVGYGRSGL